MDLTSSNFKLMLKLLPIKLELELVTNITMLLATLYATQYISIALYRKYDI